jgi:hypothetical protein
MVIGEYIFLIILGISFDIIMFSRCFRLNHTLTQYLVIFVSLVLFYCFYYFDGHRQLMKSAASVISASENWIKQEPYVVKQVDITSIQTMPTTTTSTTTRTTTEDSASLLFKSTCSASADRRGPHQNVISYSMYGKNFSEPNFYNRYLKTFEGTLKTIPIHYPGALLY